jgi:hypothetical protein
MSDTGPLVVVRQVRSQDGQHLGGHALVWCPACDKLHALGVRGDDGSRAPTEWEWNGDLERPTFSPSLLTWTGDRDNPDTRCHSYIRNGMWDYLADCTHALAGQVNVPMVPLPAWVWDH